MQNNFEQGTICLGGVSTGPNKERISANFTLAQISSPPPTPDIYSVRPSTEGWHMVFAKITKWSEIWLQTSLAHTIKCCATNFLKFKSFVFQNRIYLGVVNRRP